MRWNDCIWKVLWEWIWSWLASEARVVWCDRQASLEELLLTPGQDVLFTMHVLQNCIDWNDWMELTAVWLTKFQDALQQVTTLLNSHVQTILSFRTLITWGEHIRNGWSITTWFWSLRQPTAIAMQHRSSRKPRTVDLTSFASWRLFVHVTRSQRSSLQVIAMTTVWLSLLQYLMYTTWWFVMVNCMSRTPLMMKWEVVKIARGMLHCQRWVHSCTLAPRRLVRKATGDNDGWVKEGQWFYKTPPFCKLVWLWV